MKYIWKHRSKEWVNDNPKKGTMYKVYIDEQGKELPDPEESIYKTENGVPKKLLKPNKYGGVDERRIEKYKKSDPKKRGVYVIICEAEKHAYIGQSFNILTRLRSHKMCIRNKSDQSVYRKMHEHFTKHGMEAFQFVDYEYIEHATEQQLLNREAKIMAQFAKDGYKLYNMALSKQVIDSSIFCPDSIRTDIERLIDYIRGNKDKAQQLAMFVDSLKP